MTVIDPAARSVSFAVRREGLRFASGVRLPRRLWRRIRWGGALAVLLVSALWWGRADGGSTASGNPPPPVVPAPTVPAADRPSPIGLLLAHLEEDRAGGDTLTLQRVDVADGAIEVQAAGLSRDDVVAWAERLTARVGPTWRLATVSTDHPADVSSGVTAFIRWKGPVPAAARASGSTEAADADTRADVFAGGLVRMARWSVISRLDVEAPVAPAGRATPARQSQASVTGQMTWHQLLTVVCDVEQWAMFTAIEVVADADTGGEWLQLTARLAPPARLARARACAERGPGEGAGTSVARGAARRTRPSPFAAALPRTGVPDASAVAVEPPDDLSASGAEATVASRWMVQGIVHTVDGWRAALRDSDGDIRVVREGDVLGAEGRVTAISWDGVSVSDADILLRPGQALGRPASVRVPPSAEGGRP